jgi:hypothetical protein
MKRTGSSWIPADQYGKALPKFSVNLLVRDVAQSLLSTAMFSALPCATPMRILQLCICSASIFMLHSDHTYDHHATLCSTPDSRPSGTGAELRILGIDPDAVHTRARAAQTTILQPPTDYPHGWRDITIADPTATSGLSAPLP